MMRIVFIATCCVVVTTVASIFVYSGLVVFAQSAQTSVTTSIKISICGDLVVEGPEDCEPGPPEDLNGGTCESAGFGPGSLSCTIACDFDTSLCAAPPTPPSPSPPPGGSGGGSTTTGRLIVSLPQISFFGFANPGDTVLLLKDAQIAAATVASADGSFFFRLNELSSGHYIFGVYSENILGERSLLRTFSVEIFPQSVINVTEIFLTSGIPVEPGAIRMGDLNNDGRVDLIDFSILLYWFEKSNFPAHVNLNKDAVIDLTDFSILAYYWTG